LSKDDDVTPLGREGYAALKQKYTLPAEHLSGQLAAYAAVRTLVEGLKRSGRDLSRERLVDSLQGLYRFETGVTPPISYTLNRRIGALGAQNPALHTGGGVDVAQMSSYRRRRCYLTVTK
jgi:ABC-type branched-subunit amino acid transport system substrate-binding protein